MLIDLFLSQLTDVFRIGLLIALLFTTRSTAAQSGVVVPLLAGIVFVAVIIPTVLGQGGWVEIAVGLVSNAVIVALLGGLFLLYQRMAQR